MMLLFGNPVSNMFYFLIALVLGAIGFATLLTFVTAIAHRAGKHFTMSAILGFPLAVPLILTCIEISSACMGKPVEMGIFATLLIMVLLDLVLILLSLLLFPFLWRD
jgi:heme exporter protein B